jgi:hypothetical protein
MSFFIKIINTEKTENVFKSFLSEQTQVKTPKKEKKSNGF